MADDLVEQCAFRRQTQALYRIGGHFFRFAWLSMLAHACASSLTYFRIDDQSDLRAKKLFAIDVRSVCSGVSLPVHAFGPVIAPLSLRGTGNS
jgi:hypothetical protein